MFFPPSPKDMFIDIREEGREREEERERKREREKHGCERTSNWLPPI